MSRLMCPFNFHGNGRHEFRQRWRYSGSDPEMVVPDGFYCIHCLYLMDDRQAHIWAAEIANGVAP